LNYALNSPQRTETLADALRDPPYLVREFQARFGELDLMQLPNHRIYLKLMIDGTPSTPFSAATLAPPV
jgi:hypothetical protein